MFSIEGIGIFLLDGDGVQMTAAGGSSEADEGWGGQ